MKDVPEKLIDFLVICSWDSDYTDSKGFQDAMCSFIHDKPQDLMCNPRLLDAMERVQKHKERKEK